MLPITPDTRVAALLEAYPELEPVLVAQAPAFQKLRNPVLRRTIARVTSLEQAAGIAQISVRHLVRTLRTAVGQVVDEDDDVQAPASVDAACGSSHACGHERITTTTTLPVMAPGTPVLDADALLDAGRVPLQAILDGASRLGPADELRVLVSFRPVPIVERLEALRFACDFGLHTDGRPALRVRRRSES